MSRADAFVFVTPEYNHGTPPSLVNAIDFLVQEWAYKPAGFVSYGGAAGGARSVQMTKLMLVALKVVPVPETVLIPFFTTMIDQASGRFTPPGNLAAAADAMLSELRRWTDALQSLCGRRSDRDQRMRTVTRRLTAFPACLVRIRPT